MLPHAACPFTLRLNKFGGQRRTSCPYRPIEGLFLAVRFVERNQKGNYFRETQLSGAKHPRLVYRLALVQRCPERCRYFRTVPIWTDTSGDFPPS
ncbi:MAG: hypothetical protein LBI05_01165 [Planctomycetaceae bacterium]|nr:hypothetical protein [Planctomycetaceae bacterium]